MEEKQFRKDLYHRPNVFTIRVPPLRERLGELPGLVENLREKIASEIALETLPTLDQKAMKKLVDYSWPGNIRELRNVLERAFIHARGPSVRPEHIVFEAETGEGHLKGGLEHVPLGSKRPSIKDKAQSRTEGKASRPASRPTKPSHDAVRKLYNEYILGKGWSREQLAKHLGTDSSTVKKWFKDAGLPAGKAGRPKKKPDA